MSDDLYRTVAGLCSLLSHPARLRILDELRRGEACVCHLQAVLGQPQPYISQQLRVLRDAGVVTDRREGNNIYYQLADERVIRLLEESLGQAGAATRPTACPCPRCQAELYSEEA